MWIQFYTKYPFVIKSVYLCTNTCAAKVILSVSFNLLHVVISSAVLVGVLTQFSKSYASARNRRRALSDGAA